MRSRSDNWIRRALLCVLVATASGCAHRDIGRQEILQALSRHIESRSAVAEAYARTPVPAADDAVVGRTTAVYHAPKNLREFIVTALAENPDIQAADERARAYAERIAQVTSLPDPMLTTKTFPEPIRTAEGDNFFILGISQRIPVPAKLDARGRVALEDVRVALERLRETRLRVIAEVKRAYFRLYVLDKTVLVTRANQDLLRGLIDVARTQVAVGRRRQDDVLRAQVELSNLEAELITLRQQRVSVASRLNDLLNRPVATVIDTPEDFDIRRSTHSVERLFDVAEAENPELARIRRQVDRDRRAVELADLASWPEFTVGIEWMSMRSRDAFRPDRNPVTGLRPAVPQLSEDGSDNWAINFGFTLPIWLDKTRAGIEEAKRNLAASQHQLVSARSRVHFQVRDALERVRAQQELAGLFRDTIIPQAEQTYRVSQASYSAGASDFLYVVDNWRKWLVFSIQYFRSLGELERSVADLELAIGQSLGEEEPS